MNDLKQTEWFEPTIEEIKAIKVEYTFAERSMRIQQYWEIGHAVLNAIPLFEREGFFGRNILEKVASHVQISPRLMYDIMKFVETFKTFEEVEKLPEGKNLTWSKIVKNYLTGEENPNKARKKKEPALHVCPKCGNEFCEIGH
jgi:YesN/AraC family two-component response regulator